MIDHAISVMRTLVPVALCLAAATGCSRQLMDPFKDSGAWARADMTTASAEGYRSEEATHAMHMKQAMQERPRVTAWDTRDVHIHSDSVTHWPIWCEDPFVDKGNGPTDPNHRDAADETFALNSTDFLAIVYSPARWALNTVALPISAAVTPPGTLMVSDGRLSKQALGYDHDAQRASPNAEPPDKITPDPAWSNVPSSPAVPAPTARPASAPAMNWQKK